jgi:diguanylate cyclase (GGDEF)-like protein/putative nucleotidyltransferase with HDIG domain
MTISPLSPIPSAAAGVEILAGLLQLGVAAVILSGLLRARALRTSALAVATAGIFLAGGLQHLLLASAALLPYTRTLPAGWTPAAGWAVIAWDALSLALFAGYLRLRPLYGALSVAPAAPAAAPARQTDQVTGLPPVEEAMDVLRHLLVSAEHTGAPVAVLAIELDGLGAIDRRGDFALADRVRADVGAILRDQLKDSDTTARFGLDDRFLVVLPGADREVATRVARRTSAAIEKRLVAQLLEEPVRVCAGLAVRPDDGVDAARLVQAATETLLYARRLGGGVYAHSHDLGRIDLPEGDEDGELAWDAMRLSTRALMGALRAHHPETAEHSEAVAELAVRLASRLEYPGDDLPLLRTAALLHDIGMLGVPTELLAKPSKLTAAEYDLIRRHPRLGYELLRGTPWLQTVATYVLYHHEGVGGHGYPEKLEGQEIPLASRIIAVAEAFESMRAEHPYRGRLSLTEAVERLDRATGVQFDPLVVGALARVALGEVEAPVGMEDAETAEAPAEKGVER